MPLSELVRGLRSGDLCFVSLVPGLGGGEMGLRGVGVDGRVAHERILSYTVCAMSGWLSVRAGRERQR